jgi:hypothetical protein
MAAPARPPQISKTFNVPEICERFRPGQRRLPLVQVLNRRGILYLSAVTADLPDGRTVVNSVLSAYGCASSCFHGDLHGVVIVTFLHVPW